MQREPLYEPAEVRARQKHLRDENKRYGHRLERLREIPNLKGIDGAIRTQAWRSRTHLVQVFVERQGDTRLTINRTEMDGRGDWLTDQMDWETIQRLKAECGFGGTRAFEVFPEDEHVINDFNMRHLWMPLVPLRLGKYIEEITTRDGLLYRGEFVIPLPEADAVAIALGFHCAEALVRDLERRKRA